MSRDGYRFATGVPTKVDVDELAEKIGAPAVGSTVAYSTVEAIIHVGHRENRFRTITAAWRKLMEKEHNLLSEAVPNEGFLFLTNSDRVAFVAKGFHSALRKSRVVGRRSAETSRVGLSVEQVRTLDHVANTSAVFTVQAALAARKLRELK